MLGGIEAVSGALLEAARRVRTVKRVLVASSDKAYGTHEQLPYTEDAPLLAHHPYDVSKACAEMLARTYAVTYDLPVAVTRCANLYGGGDLNWNRIVPGTMRSVIYGERPIIRSDGTLVRDYLYIQDGVTGYMRLAQALDDPALAGEAFNFGGGNLISIRDLVRLISRLFDGKEREPVFGGSSRDIPLCKCLDTSKARRVLGWQPSISLVDGLKETIQWYRRFWQSYQQDSLES